MFNRELAFSKVWQSEDFIEAQTAAIEECWNDLQRQVTLLETALKVGLLYAAHNPLLLF